MRHNKCVLVCSCNVYHVPHGLENSVAVPINSGNSHFVRSRLEARRKTAGMINVLRKYFENGDDGNTKFSVHLDD